ncbi:hypothetical protein [Kosmotoga pacifica]|uniref:hypothetical protein n=1 Tax=Kosmotoga pacifica TaxID=1330330 RepID=UPI0012E0377D|nr:hypothetical protein [Kosmotoga pacifica]
MKKLSKLTRKDKMPIDWLKKIEGINKLGIEISLSKKDEELSIVNLFEALDDWAKRRPRIVLKSSLWKN